MKFLFIHNNFPGQFVHLVQFLSQNKDNEIVFLSQHKRHDVHIDAVKLIQVPIPRIDAKQITSESHKAALETFYTGEVFGKKMTELARDGFYPDVVHAHPGWGGSAYVPDIFPEAAYVVYGEWFYTKGANYTFFSRQPKPPAAFAANRQRNHCQLDALRECDVAITPTCWQFSQYPAEYAHKLRLLHDGIDTDFFSPAKPQTAEAGKNIVQGLDLDSLPEIVTYATRGMEPYRGFPQFFKSIPKILAARPNCHIVIMANDEIRYSAARKDGRTWGEAMREEVPYAPERVHFLNFGPYEEYRRVLRASLAHVYLTAPFVLSWSLLEAMSCGCLVAASATPPVQEVISHKHNGFLTSFWDSDALAKLVAHLLEYRQTYGEIRGNARKTIVERYDLRKLLPQHVQVLLDAAERRATLKTLRTFSTKA